MIAPKLRFSEFKDEWRSEKISEIANVSSGSTPNRNNPSYWNGDIPWITTSLINFNTIEKAEEFITKEGLKNSSTKLYPKNTILMAMYGQGVTRGKVAILGIEATTNQACASISLKPNFNVNFIFQNLSKRYEEIRDLSNDGGQKNLSGSIIKEISISYPTEKEQTKIAEFLSAVDDKISQLSRQLELLNQYKKGVMQKIFSQEIRFKNDNGEDFGEWDEKSIDEITEVVGGGTPSTSNQEYWDGEIVWLTPSEINRKYISKSKRTISIEGVNNSSAKILPKGTVLFTSRATIGEVAIAQNEVTTNQGFQSFIVKTDILNEFLYYWLIFNKNLFLERASGSTFLEVSKNSIKLITISLPPFLEQQKIAEFLTAIDERIDHTTAQLNHTKQWKKGLLQQMFV